MKTSKIKKLVVDTPQGVSGHLNKDARFVFNYTTAQRPCEVSLGMPLRSESYADGRLPPIFEMNRPEGYLLDRLRKRFAKLGGLDDMRLLALTGRNQIGRLLFYEPDDEKAKRDPQVGLRTILESDASEALFEFLADTYLDSGISGFQPKVMIPDMDNTGVALKSSIISPDLIIKAAGDDYPFLAQNEFLCMMAAKEAGMSVPDFWLSNTGSLFVMSRFDIADGLPLGFEDMAVVMAKPAENKYSGSYEGIAKAIALYCRENTIESLRRYFEYLVLCVMVRNGDAHLKNFGLLYDHPDGAAPYLSPLFDVVTTTVYEYENQRTGRSMVDRTLALKFNKDRKYPTREALIDFGRKICHVSNPQQVFERIGDAMTSAMERYRDRLDKGFARRLFHEWDTGRVALEPDRILFGDPTNVYGTDDFSF